MFTGNALLYALAVFAAFISWRMVVEVVRSLRFWFVYDMDLVYEGLQSFAVDALNAPIPQYRYRFLIDSQETTNYPSLRNAWVVEGNSELLELYRTNRARFDELIGLFATSHSLSYGYTADYMPK